MLNLFYQNKTLNDTLIINVSLATPDVIKTDNGITIGYKNNSIVFANIAKASEKIDKSMLVDGLLFPSKPLIDTLNNLLKVNLESYFDNGFRIGQIVQCEDISGTHLHKCIVNIGNKQLNIVCGAANARTGLKVVVATNGTMLPNGKAIIAGQLLGHKSEGMLCSYRELAINKESKGIIELDDSFNVGDYFKPVYANQK